MSCTGTYLVVTGDVLLTCNVYIYGHIAPSDRGFGAIFAPGAKGTGTNVYSVRKFYIYDNDLPTTRRAIRGAHGGTQASLLVLAASDHGGGSTD